MVCNELEMAQRKSFVRFLAYGNSKVLLIFKILKSILCEYNFTLKMTHHNLDLFL